MIKTTRLAPVPIREAQTRFCDFVIQAECYSQATLIARYDKNSAVLVPYGESESCTAYCLLNGLSEPVEIIPWRGIGHAKSGLSKLVRAALYNSQTTVITRHGTPVAALVPPQQWDAFCEHLEDCAGAARSSHAHREEVAQLLLSTIATTEETRP